MQGVVTATGAVYRCRAAVICSGTYLGGRTIVGEVSRWSGPDGMFGALRQGRGKALDINLLGV